MKEETQARAKQIPLTKSEARVRARALYEAATIIMQLQPSWTDSGRGTIVNKLDARDAIVSLVNRAAVMPDFD